MNKIWLVAGVLSLAGCSSSPESETGSSSSTQSQSKASAYAKQVTAANLDSTTLEEFTAQMPSNMQPNIERSGENRTFVNGGLKVLKSPVE